MERKLQFSFHSTICVVRVERTGIFFRLKERRNRELDGERCRFLVLEERRKE